MRVTKAAAAIALAALAACSSKAPVAEQERSESEPSPTQPGPSAPKRDGSPADRPSELARDASAGTAASLAVKEVVGEPTARAIAEASKVRTYRIDPHSFDPKAGGSDRFGGYRIIAKGRVLDADFARRMSTLLSSDEIYARNIDKNACRQDVALGLAFEGKLGEVDLLFLFPCNRVVFLRRPDSDPLKMPGEYFDPGAAKVIALVKEAFPDDKDVQGL